MAPPNRTNNAENRGTVSKAWGYSVPNAGGTVETGNTMGARRGIHGGGGHSGKGMGIHNAKEHGGTVWKKRTRAHNERDRINNLKARGTVTKSARTHTAKSMGTMGNHGAAECQKKGAL